MKTFNFNYEEISNQNQRMLLLKHLFDILNKKLPQQFDQANIQKENLLEVKKYRGVIRVNGANIFVYTNAGNLQGAKIILTTLYKPIKILNIEQVGRDKNH